MYLFYTDEAGSPDPHPIPLEDGYTPLFVLGSISVNSEIWRDFDRDFLVLKLKYFRQEIIDAGHRPEVHEIKGSYLVRPGNKNKSRNMAFIGALFSLLENYEVKLFGIIVKKNSESPIGRVALYSMSLQYLLERFSPFLLEKGEEEEGVVIVDSRASGIDYQVSLSTQSFLFGHETGQTFRNIVEGPLFVDSRASAGVQVADIVCSCIYGSYYYRNCKDIEGALDYSHLDYLHELLRNYFFVSKYLHDGRKIYGRRFIVHGPK